MKKFILLSLSLLLMGSLFAQSNQQGNINLNIGVGFEPTFFPDSSDVDIVPLHLSADYSINSFLSVGVGVLFSGSIQEYLQDSLSLTRTEGFTHLGVRAQGHLPLPIRSLDIYAGGFLGAQQQVESVQSTDPSAPSTEPIKGWSLHYAGHLGIRYRLGDFIAVYAEGSYGLSLVQAGINFRL